MLCNITADDTAEAPIFAPGGASGGWSKALPKIKIRREKF
jgi:hypothetical protein